MGVGVRLFIITSVILGQFQQMRHLHLQLFIPQILRPATFWLVNSERSFRVNRGQKGHEAENRLTPFAFPKEAIFFPKNKLIFFSVKMHFLAKWTVKNHILGRKKLKILWIKNLTALKYDHVAWYCADLRLRKHCYR